LRSNALDPQLELLVTTSETLSRHFDFDPELAEGLLERGRLFFGEHVPPAKVPTVSDAERLARIARAAYSCSALLAPGLLSTHEATHLQSSLYSLYESLVDASPDPALPPLHLLRDVYQVLARRLAGYEDPGHQLDSRTPKAQPMSGVIAVYEKQQGLIIVVEEDWLDDFATRVSTDGWQRLSERADGHYRSIHVTTAKQLRLLAGIDDAADYFLGYYARIWGQDILGDLDIDHKRVLRDLGRWPSYLALAEMAQLLASSADNELFMLVHDLQNKLLNVQLRNELFSRRLGLKPQAPPITLPEPSAPVQQRLEAVSAHLLGWADHYWEAMHSVDERPN
jgi:hypothetical protein